jgi:Flp pilus assembly protein TadB
VLDLSLVRLLFLFFAIIAIVAVAGIGVTLWRFTVRRAEGKSPLAASQQLASRRYESQLAPAPSGRSVEERLAELDQLNARGVISDQERADGRARIIAGS